MKLFRSLLFWLHLATGVVAGAVILVMAITGVALTYEKQVLEWADRQSLATARAADGQAALPPQALVAAASGARPGARPIALSRRAQSTAPATVTFDGGALLVDPIRGTPLGEPSPRLRAFFRTMTNWHRWLAFEGADRAAGRALTGAANLAFFGLIVSGIYLWVPRRWSRRQVAQVAWFRRGLPAKAREFNWHHVFGIWAAVPLLVVVAGAVPISFPWASDAVYRLAGEAPPPRPAAGAPSGRPPSRGTAPVSASLTGLDAAWTAVERDAGAWRAITVRLGPGDAPYVFTVDHGFAGQPQLRRTVTVDRASATIVSRETFDGLSTGRQLRSWLRFAHTGEYYGLAGQTVAGLASAAGAVLVYTGIALACRRAFAWPRRRRSAPVDVADVLTRRSPS